MKLWKIMAVAALAAGPAHVALGQDIKIGALLETSGAIASLGQPTLEGAQLAIDQANAAGGIQGRKIVLVNVNSESDNTKTVSGARRLLSQEKVSAVIGPVSSGSNFAVADVIERAKVPMIANGASRGIVLPPEKRRYTFIAPLTDEIVQTVMLRDMQARHITKVAMLHSDVAFGTNGRDTLNRLAAQYGVQVVATETFGRRYRHDAAVDQAARQPGPGHRDLGHRPRPGHRHPQPSRAGHRYAALPYPRRQRLQLPAAGRGGRQRHPAAIVQAVRRRVVAVR